MPKFSVSFQRAHDIDWFVHVGKYCIHAMSFGGLLPFPVNERNKNFVLMRKAFQVEPQVKQLYLNSYYIDRRLNRYHSLYSEEEYINKRNRYLVHFEQMAMRGFVSFDRDLDDEAIYHLIVRPQQESSMEWFISRMPELPESIVKIDKKTNDVILDLHEYIGKAV